MIDVELRDPLRDPEPEGWTDFRTRENLPATWEYRVLRHASESWTPVSLTVFRDGGKIVGAVAALFRGLRTWGRPRRWAEPLVVDVRLPGDGHGRPTWHFAADVPAETRRELLGAFERAAARRFGWGLVAFAYRNVPVAEVGLVERRGATVRDTAGDADMRLSTLDGWLAGLKSTRRAELRRRRRRLDADPDLTVAIAPGRTDLDADELARMMNDHAGAREGRVDRRAPLPASYFAALTGLDDVSTLTYTGPDGRLLAAGVYFHHPVRPRLSWWASVPPEQGGRKHLYYDSYLRYVEYAVAMGGEGLSAGRGTLDIKAELGFSEVPLKLVVVPRWARR